MHSHHCSDQIKSVHCGSSSFAVLTKLGRVYTWGRGELGELGQGSEVTVSETPVKVQVKDVIKVNARDRVKMIE